MAVYTRIGNGNPWELTPGGPAIPPGFTYAFNGDSYMISEDSTHWTFTDGANITTFTGTGMSVSLGLLSGTINAVSWVWSPDTLLATFTGIGVSVSGVTHSTLFFSLHAGNDTLNGFSYGEDIRGENGNDLIYGNGGADIVTGGNGSDTIHGGNGADYIYGDHGEFYNDPLEGDDVLYGYGGSDQMYGGHGNDRIFGGGGDQGGLHGDWGDDFIVGGATVSDHMTGGDGDDTIEAGLSLGIEDYLRGGANTAVGDTLSYSRFVAVTGTQGVTVDLRILAVQDTGAGRDSIGEFENLTGSSHDDALTGDDLGNVLSGRNGNDLLSGVLGNDSLSGGTGDDTLDGGEGDDTLNGGEGIDRAVFGGAGAVTVNLGRATAQDTGQGTDLFRNVEGVTSGAGNDRLTGGSLDNSLIAGGGNDTVFGGAGNDTVEGGAENDWIEGGAGDDLIDGGEGSDRAVFSGGAAATVNLSLVGAQDTGRGIDTILGIEHVTSGGGDDELTGNAGANGLIAGAGNDTLAGGGGDDTLTGGAGGDVFVFGAALGGGNVARVLDFDVAADLIRLDSTVFAGLGGGALDAGAFVANAAGTAADAMDRILYASDTGRLFYDANGSAAGGRVHFATLTANLALTADDFTLI